MKGTINKLLAGFLIAGFLVALTAGMSAQVKAQGALPPNPDPVLLPDGMSMANAVRPLVVMVNPDPAAKGLRTDGPTAAEILAGPHSEAATFSITYIAAGGTDFNGQTCVAFPDAAKTAFAAAAAIWASQLQSSVPLTVQACWANLGSPFILGYSGGQYVYRDFAGAPKPGVWYESSLANALHGSDLGPGIFDINITYNSEFSWYTGTDGNPPAGQYDLVSVAAHEIGHGLNFSGSAQYSGGTGQLGFSSGYPFVYDTFMENGAGTPITSLANPSTALGSVLTGGDLWFNGANSKAANGGNRVKIYAPGGWMQGSSYSHLDYDTFAGTANSMMVYAIADGSAQHNPGPVTLGMFKDMGWPAPITGVPTPKTPSGAIADTTPTYTWTKVAGATQYRYQLMKGTTLVYTKLAGAAACGTTTCSSTPTNVLTTGSYKWHVQAMVSGVWKPYSAFKAFSITFTPTPVAPSGAITDTTPTFKWTRILGATQYRYELKKGTTLVYTKLVGAAVCGVTYCTNTPTTVLSGGSYSWRVQALIGGVWRPYSAAKAFSISSKPRAGFYESTTGDEFYVTTDQRYVDDFAIYVSVTGCGSYKITHTVPVAITNNHFAFSGAFYASGTFKTATSVSGTDGLTSFYITGCGYVKGGPWTYTAVWKSTAQPLPATAEPSAGIDVVALIQQTLAGYHVVQVDSPAP